MTKKLELLLPFGPDPRHLKRILPRVGIKSKFQALISWRESRMSQGDCLNAEIFLFRGKHYWLLAVG
jgi:hypothetical protein